jgi:uncharacterized protein Yka (UPF0111/DUF47 family)
LLDAIDSIAERLVLFEISESSGVSIRAAQVLEASILALTKAVELLPNARARAQEILRLCEEIGSLESEADELYRQAIAELFNSGKDALFIMKWRDIYEQLEAATDVCEDVANTLEGVVLEYG